MKVMSCRFCELVGNLSLVGVSRKIPPLRPWGSLLLFFKSVRFFKYLWTKWLGMERNNLKDSLWEWSNGNENKMLIVWVFNACLKTIALLMRSWMRLTIKMIVRTWGNSKGEFEPVQYVLENISVHIQDLHPHAGCVVTHREAQLTWECSAPWLCCLSCRLRLYLGAAASWRS